MSAQEFLDLFSGFDEGFIKAMESWVEFKQLLASNTFKASYASSREILGCLLTCEPIPPAHCWRISLIKVDLIPTPDFADKKIKKLQLQQIK